ncbi:alpha/beta-hydrolase [Pseudovirgaria hyperparasitica]|uniref:Alpha/beta-hydrolase n=1 Tax=Pseudovirgaria hyperparasitica TaxID=470096 RepID=A0A6A6WAC8_9PEZI|nr:alpha/beta-hydrolase [Pseudovirgaria hyperparasitica]KAF2758547.1 alpha/beta-hydrolase [Pseudovirgaria hyperparasitica]
MEATSTLSTTVVGDGIPVLFIHGWEMNGASEAFDYEPIFSTLDGYKRIYVDLPGMGSTPADGIRNLDDIWARLTDLVDAQIGSSRFLVVGASCGSYLARAIAQRYTTQINGLLLRVPVTDPENEKRDLDVFRPLLSNADVMSKVPEKDKTTMGDFLVVQTAGYIQALLNKIAAIVNPAVEQADIKVLHTIRNDPKAYLLTAPLEITPFPAPALILTGRQDTHVGYRDSLRLLGSYPRATHVVLDRGSHALPVDEPERILFEALVKEWLSRVQEWACHRD